MGTLGTKMHPWNSCYSLTSTLGTAANSPSVAPHVLKAVTELTRRHWGHYSQEMIELIDTARLALVEISKGEE